MLTLDRDGLKDRERLNRDLIEEKMKLIKEPCVELAKNELLTSGLAVLPLAYMVFLEARDTLKFGDVSMRVYQADDERQLGIWRFEYGFMAPCGNRRFEYKWSIRSDGLGEYRDVEGMGKTIAEQFMAEFDCQRREMFPASKAP